MLDKIEQVMQATTQALRALGLEAFRLDLTVYDHYDYKGWRELADEGCRRGYSNKPLESIRVIENLSGKTESGETKITIFVPMGWRPMPVNEIVAEHATALEGIVQKC